MKERIIAFIIFFFGIYSHALSQITGIETIDELGSLMLIPFIFFRFRNPRVDKGLIQLIVLLFAALLLGVFSSLYFGYQGAKISFFGALVYFKSLIPFLFIVSYVKSYDLNFNKFIRSLEYHLYFSISIITIGNFFQFFNNNTENWHGLPRFFSFFDPPSAYGIVMSFLCLIFFYLTLYRKQRIGLAVLLLISLIISLRVKSLAFALLLLYFYLAGEKIINTKSTLIGTLAFIAVLTNDSLVDLITLKLNSAFFSESSIWDAPARFALHAKSIIVAIDHFPLGSGFSTFGSHFSRVSYSPLYQHYGLNGIWGLSPENPSFVADTQISPIIAELGLVGSVFYFLYLRQIFRYSFGKWKFLYQPLKKVFLICLGFILVNITSSQILFNNASAGVYSLLATIYLFRSQLDINLLTIKNKII